MDDKKKSVIEPEKCPGSADIRRPKLSYQKCPNCGGEVEMWTDEFKAVCENCGQTVFKDDTPSCFEWCEHAAECIGADKYKELMARKKEASGGADPTSHLREEHQLILRLIAVLEREAAAVESGKPFDPAFFEKAVDFIRVFADKFHHGKEEDLLFPWLEERGIDRVSGPIGVMLEEHGAGRAFVRKLAEACGRFRSGGADASSIALENARGYARLLMQHIEKEDGILYPLADKTLSEGDARLLFEAFMDVENRLGKDTRERYTAVVASLEKGDSGR